MTGARDERIERYLYAFDWDVEGIWKLPLAVALRDISDLDWMLALPVWPGRKGPYSLTPLEVLADPKLHAAEFVRLARAETDYPIDITFHDDRWVVLDGLHRLAKLHREGAKTVRVRVVPQDALLPK